MRTVMACTFARQAARHPTHIADWSACTATLPWGAPQGDANADSRRMARISARLSAIAASFGSQYAVVQAQQLVRERTVACVTRAHHVALAVNWPSLINAAS